MSLREKSLADMQENTCYPRACYNIFALSGRQNFPPLDEVFGDVDCDAALRGASLSDPEIPDLTWFDLSSTETNNNIFSARERAVLEKHEDNLVLLNARWWMEKLSETTHHAVSPPQNGQGMSVL